MRIPESKGNQANGYGPRTEGHQVNIPSRFKPKPSPRTRLGRYLRPRSWWAAPLGAVIGITTGVASVVTFKAIRDLRRKGEDELAAKVPTGEDPANIGDRPSDDVQPPVV